MDGTFDEVTTQTLNVRNATRCASDPREINLLSPDATLADVIAAIQELQYFAANNGDATLIVQSQGPVR